MENIESPFEIGKAYFFRCLTYHTVGKVQRIIGQFIKLEDASWVADSGRFGKALQKGELDEVEPTGICYLNIQSIVDAFPWKHKLPTTQK